MDGSPPGSSVHWLLQARILKWAAIPLSRVSFLPGGLKLPLLHFRWIFYHWATRETHRLNYSPSKDMSKFLPLVLVRVTFFWKQDLCRWGHAYHTLVIPFSRESSLARDSTWISCFVGRFFTVWATRQAHTGHIGPLIHNIIIFMGEEKGLKKTGAQRHRGKTMWTHGENASVQWRQDRNDVSTDNCQKQQKLRERHEIDAILETLKREPGSDIWFEISSIGTVHEMWDNKFILFQTSL